MLGLAAARVSAVSRRPAGLGAVETGLLSLMLGEYHAATPWPIVDSAMTSLRRGRTHYAPLAGYPPLLSAIAAQVTAQSGRPVDAANIVVTHGASAALAATVIALVEPGDRVVLAGPTYSLYADLVAMVGGEIDWVAAYPPAGESGGADLEPLLAALPGARLVVLCNPNNPTGHVLDGPAVAVVAEAARRHGATLVVDEAYRDIVFDGPFESAVSAAGLESVVVVRTFSKTFAMTGWRLGYVIADETVAAQIGIIHRTINGALNTTVQDAGCHAMGLDPQVIRTMRAQLRASRDRMVAHLEALPVRLTSPAGGFYCFVRPESERTDDEVVARCAQEGVRVRSGSEYGPAGAGHLRLSFSGDPGELDEALSRLGRAIRWAAR